MSETHKPAPAFDGEINVKGIAYTGIGLAAVVVVSAVLMWWMLRGFAKYDDRHDVRPSPIQAANPQQPPPAPNLQVAPGFAVLNPQTAGLVEQSDREDMDAEREAENKILTQPGWVDQGRGIVRVPIDVAMQMVAQHGLAPLNVPPPPPAIPEERRLP
jgi:hypothetical protein